MEGSKVISFGGTVVGASIANSDNNAVTSTPSVKMRKTVAPSTSAKQRSDTVVRHKVTIDDIKYSSDVIGATLNIKHGLGCQPTTVDAITSYNIHSATSDKDSADRVLFRVGKQICVYGTDTKSQSYFEGRNRRVKNVLHFTISPNNKYVAACESLRLEKDDEMPPQISVYNLTTMARYKTLPYPCEADFVQSTFCGDMKFIASLTGEADRQIIVWQWEKEKVYKTINLANIPVTRIRSSPSNAMMITGSGRGIMKCWFLGPDGMPRTAHLLPANRESESFIDHIWLPAVGGVTHRVIALCDFSDAHSNSTQANSQMNVNSVGLSGGSFDHLGSQSASIYGAAARRQHVFVLEGQDVANQSSLTSAPINLEFRQYISVRINDPLPNQAPPTHNNNNRRASEAGSASSGTNSQSQSIYTSNAHSQQSDSHQQILTHEFPRIEAVIPFSKGFILIGGNGFVALYERAVDKRENFVEVRRLCLGDLWIISATLIQNEEKIVCVGRSNRMVTFPLISDESASASSSSSNNVADLAVQALLGKGASKDNDSNLNGDLAGDKVASPTGETTSDLIAGGFHLSGISALDIARERPLVCTVSAADKSFRLWNYETFECKILHHFRADEPLAVALHPLGFQVLVSFKDRVKLYNVLGDKLKSYKEAICKNCKEIRYSNGGHMWATASSINVCVFDSITFKQLSTFQGHISYVKRLAWSPGDEILFSAGTDGNVYGWPMAREGRIDCVSASGRTSSSILGLTVDCPLLLFRKSAQHADGEEEVVVQLSAQQIREQSCTVVVSTSDATLKIPSWTLDTNVKGTDSSNIKVVPPDDKRVYVTALLLSADRKYLFAGTSNGALRAYLWPPPTDTYGTIQETPYAEVLAHSSAVVSIRESPLGNTIMSAAEDGTVFFFSFLPEAAKPSASTATAAKDTGTTTSAAVNLHDLLAEFSGADVSFNNEVVLMANEDVDDHVREIITLHKDLEQQKNQSELMLATKVLQHNEEVKKLTEVNEIIIKDEKLRYEHLRIEFDRKVRELLGVIEHKDAEHVKVTSELENRYEHKIADQMERYDRLSEDMELLKQKYEGLIKHDREKHTAEKKVAEVETRAKEKKLKTENRRIAEDRQADGNAFKEILDQQEREYEAELRELVAAAESELTNEREIIMKLRTLVQTKNTKIDQIKKKWLECNNGLKAKIIMLKNEREENKKLQETIEHYKKNLREREDALSEKEKIILELRSTTRTLENFRFVLDHRLQQLSSERGPITAHIEGLERHITTMYEELVEEFDLKKDKEVVMEQKDQKIALLTNELAKLRRAGKFNEGFIVSFKRELGNIVNSMIVGKDLEECIKVLYKRYVRGEKVVDANSKTREALQEKIKDYLSKDDESGSAASDLNDHGNFNKTNRYHGKTMTAEKVHEVDDALIESAKEAIRQKRFVERDCSNLKHRLESASREITHISKTKLAENSNLIFECNNLRRELKDSHRKLAIVTAVHQETERTVNKLKKLIREGKACPQAGDEDYDLVFGQNPTAPPAMVEADDTTKTAAVETQPPSNAATSTRSAGQLTKRAFFDMEQVVEAAVEAEFVPKDIHPQAQSSNSGATKEGLTIDLTDAVAKPVAETGRKWVVHNSLSYSQSTGILRGQSATNPNGLGVSGKSANAGARSMVNLPTSTEVVEVPPSKRPIVNGAAIMMHNQHNEVVIDRLSGEIETMAQQLDDSNREIEMQRREIARLKRLMMKSANPSLPSPTQRNSQVFRATNESGIIFTQTNNDIANLSMDESNHQVHQDGRASSIAVGLKTAMQIDRSLTNADITGRPSESELKDLALVPIYTTTRAASASRQSVPRSGKSGQFLPPAAVIQSRSHTPVSKARGKNSISVPGRQAMVASSRSSQGYSGRSTSAREINDENSDEGL